MAARSAWPAPTSCRVSSVQIGRHRSSSREPAIASACATSAHCIGNAVEQIQLNKQDVVFAGGGEEEHWTLSCLFDGMGALSSKYNDTPETASRAYDASRDGFVIAEEDLKLRGPGEWLGTRQTGDLAFRIADLVRDEALMAPAREVASALLAQYPDRVERLLRRWLRGGEHFADV